MSFIAANWAGRIGTNFIYSEFSGSRGRPRENFFPKFPFLKKIQKKGDNSKILFSVKKTTRGRRHMCLSFIAAHWDGRIGTNLNPLKKCFQNSLFFKKNLKRRDNSKNLFSVKKRHVDGQTRRCRVFPNSIYEIVNYVMNK